jgi:flagellin FlaB
MTNLVHQLLKPFRHLWRDQKGITGLETAIVLIAFVVVSSVFAFAALSTGLFTTDRAKETIRAGLSEARGTMEMRGSLLAVASTGTTGSVTSLHFQVANAAAGEAIDLTPGNTVIKYSDPYQTINFDTSSEFAVTVIGGADSDNLLEKGEVLQIDIPPTGTTLQSLLTPDLGTNTQFTLEVIPPTGATLYIQRTTPGSFEALQNLD